MTTCMQHDGISYDQARQITTLVADVARRADAPWLQGRMLMEGLRCLTDADGWVWSARRYESKLHLPERTGLLHDGLSDIQVRGWINGRTSERRPPEESPLTALALQGGHFTRTRQELVFDEAWYSHPFVRQRRLRKGIDHFLCSFYPLAPRHYSVITLFRRVGRESFSPVERRLCHIVVEATASFHHSVFDSHKPKEWDGLTPRQRSVLIHLLHGRSREEIADLLRISPDTAKTHIQSVYRYFGVDSQVRLMQHCYHDADSATKAEKSV